MQDDDDVLTRKRKADSLVEDKKAEENVDQITEKDILTFVPTKSTAEGVWQPVLGLVQVRKLRGNFWKKCGFTVNGVDFLYPEEALTLYERKSIAVYFQDGPMMDKRQFFDACLKVIPISVYLVYAKLRALDYIVSRHKKSVRVLSGDAELYGYLKANPTHSLLDAMVGYDLYIYSQGFTKKASKTLSPVGYVVLTDGPVTFSARVMLRLIDEANGVPVIFAVITSTGYVVLEEFTDATRSLQLGVSQPKAHASQGQECCAQHEKQDTVAPEGIVPHDDEAEMEEGDDENGEGEAISIHGEGSSEDDDLVVEEITLSQPSS